MLGKALLTAATGMMAEGEALGVEDVFSTFLYTGNGSTQTITNGIDLAGEGGLVWTKTRNQSNYQHWLFDTNRGATKYLFSALSNAEGASANTLTSFNSNGFTVGNYSGNAVSDSIVSWTFRKAAKFFDVVTYVGNNTPGRAIPHNLGSVPGCIIVKQLDAANDWVVYHRANTAEPATDFLVLNSTAATADDINRWNDTPPTSTVFTVGDSVRVNGAGGTYVAYLFAHDAGGFGDSGNESVIKCGSFSYTSGSPLAVSLGWEPQWLLVKRSDGSDSWFIADTMRGSGHPTGAWLQANTSNSEGNLSGYGVAAPTATGFIFDPGTPLFASSTYIYIAIRRGPMKMPTDATKVFSAQYGSDVVTAPSYSTAFPVDLVIDGYRVGGFAGSQWFVDRLRGKVALVSASTGAESATYASNLPLDFSNGAFSGVNSSHVGWLFRRAPGFLDVVAYTGTGSVRTVAHNLGVAPELMIVKGRTYAGLWGVYAASLGIDYRGQLNTTDPFYSGSISFWNATVPTSTVFTLGANASVNGSGYTYIAYLFATCPGVSKVGSYTGTGATLNIDCGFTNGARFVLIKRTDSTGDWYVWDTARGIVSGNDPYLLLNSTAAENTSTDYIDPLSSGFQISSTAPAAINANGGSFVFLAIS